MKYRDLTITPLGNNLQMITACDTSSGLGNKPGDTFSVSPRIVASYCARVIFFELLAYGVEPEIVINMVGGEYDNTGFEALCGLQDEIQLAGIGNIEINGSTEENMETTMTSINMVGIGFCRGEREKKKIEKGDLIYSLGTPYVGEQVVAHMSEIISYENLRQIKAMTEVLDVLPVGSKGILYEAEIMAQSAGWQFNRQQQVEHDAIMYASAGPATALVVGVQREAQHWFEKKWETAKLIGFFC